ncbi:Hypothetical predicted protein, partial [Paramuricea clavata]
RALQNHVIEVVHEYSPLDCGFACLQTTDCQSYNIRQETTDLYECELSSSTKTQHPNDFKSISGVTYYGSDTFHGQVIHSRPYKDDRSHVLMGLGYDFEFIGGQSGVCYHNFVCIWSWRVKSKITVNDCNHLCGCSISYYPNSTAKFRPVLLLKYDIEINPGPGTQNSTNILQHKLKFLSLNSRSIVNKANHLTALESVNEHDLIAI